MKQINYKENARKYMEENGLIDYEKIINIINNALKFFKENKQLISYTKFFEIKQNDKKSNCPSFTLTIKRSKKYIDCLDLTIDNALSNDRLSYQKIELEEIEYDKFLRTFFNALFNLYDCKGKKDKENEEKDKQ